MSRSSRRSDADLRDAVIAGWHRLVTGLRPTDDPLGTLVKRTGMPFRQLDMARRVRNQVAHPDEPVARDRLLGALRIITEAEQQLRGRRARPVRRDRSKRPPAPRRKASPTKPANHAKLIVAIVFAVLIVAALIVLISF